MSGRNAIASGIAKRLLALAEASNDPAKLVIGHGHTAVIAYWMGELSLARTHYAQAWALSDPPSERHLAERYGMDMATGRAGYESWNLWVLGYPEQCCKASSAACPTRKNAPI